MNQGSKGFSLIELLMALTITMGVGMAVFQLFRQNEQVFRDQNLMIEMQQAVRAVASQIGDEVRMAGQGVPIYASRFDSTPGEATAAILPSSSSSRIDFRAGLSNVETHVTSPLPIDCDPGVSRTLSVGDVFPFSNALGTNTPAGKFVYVWGPTGTSTWTWVRAELNGIGSGTLTVTPRQAGSPAVRFTQPPTVSLEEAVSFQLSGTAIRRATATDMTDPTTPTWAAANEIGRNFQSLVFTYYDRKNLVVIPGSLAARLSIARIDVGLAVQPSNFLSNGKRPIYSISLRTIPRNLRIR